MFLLFPNQQTCNLWLSCRCRWRTHLTYCAVGGWPRQQRTLTWAQAPMGMMHLCQGTSRIQTASCLTTQSFLTTHVTQQTIEQHQHYIKHVPVMSQPAYGEFWREGSQEKRSWSWTLIAGWGLIHPSVIDNVLRCFQCSAVQQRHWWLLWIFTDRMAWWWPAAKAS